jgi:peptidoglycan hydrolase CwlO-like protein
MGKIENPELLRVRRQRHFLSTTAVLTITIGMGVTLPHAIKRRMALHAAHDELLNLQTRIVDLQVQIQDVQAKIIRTQALIRSAQNEN